MDKFNRKERKIGANYAKNKFELINSPTSKNNL